MIQLHHSEIEQVLAWLLRLESVIGKSVVQVAKSLIQLWMELAVDSVLERELLGSAVPSKGVK